LGSFKENVSKPTSKNHLLTIAFFHTKIESTLMKLSTHFKRIALTLALGFAVSACAHASLVGVKSIEVSSASNDWLQVTEISAINTLGVDVAAASNGGTAMAPSSWGNFATANLAIDGNTDGYFWNGSVFHSGATGPLEILTITFSAVQNLDFVGIWGRMDCCSYRDIYNVSFFNGVGDLLLSVPDVNAANTHFVAMTFYNTAVAPVPVPEPVSTAIFGLGLMVLALRGRKTS
jgi:hypothetical protein